jgi:hypothetical protein
MDDRASHPYGPFAVAFMALHDRAFFEALLKSPRKAIMEKVAEGVLKLTEAEVNEAVRVAETAFRSLSPREGLAIWDRWNLSGKVQPGDWPDPW